MFQHTKKTKVKRNPKKQGHNQSFFYQTKEKYLVIGINKNNNNNESWY